MWWEILGRNEVAHSKCGVDIDRPTSWRRVVAYVAKYLGKCVDDLLSGWEHVGRWWGYFNRRAFARQIDEITVSPDVGGRLRRMLCRDVFKRDRRDRLQLLAREWLSISAFGPEDRWRRILERLNDRVRSGKGVARHRRWFLKRLAMGEHSATSEGFSSGFDVFVETDVGR